MNLKGMFGKAKKWAGEHKVELAVGGFGLVCAGIGVYVGYEAGWNTRLSIEQENAKKLANNLAVMVEDLVENCGFTGCGVATEENFKLYPDLTEQFLARVDQNPPEHNFVKKAYYEDDYVKRVLEMADELRTLGLGALEEVREV